MQSNPLTEASRFLSPVLDRASYKSLRCTTVIGSLFATLPETFQKPTKSEPSEQVITYAASLLQRIHTRLLINYKPTPSPEDIFSPKDRRIITALLDLLAIEGIYPCLTPGLGIPIERRAKAIIPPSRNISKNAQELCRVKILIQVVNVLAGILKDGKGEVANLLKDRCLVDLVAGCGELAFNPSNGDELTEEGQQEWRRRWDAIIEGISTPQLLPLLMSLIHSQCPKWFLAPVTSLLSIIPIQRPHAVRHILQLFLTSPSQSTSDPQPTGIPSVPLDALARAARLLGSVPKSISTDKWFHTITPQLFDIIHAKQGISDEGLQRAAAYVVAEFLAKRGTEDVIDREIVRPILQGLDPDYGSETEDDQSKYVPTKTSLLSSISGKPIKTSKALLELEKNDSPEIETSTFRPVMSVISSEDEDILIPDAPVKNEDLAPLVPERILLTTLTTLSLLLECHPTPLIPEKLLKPAVLPLWGLMCTAKEKKKIARWVELPRTLLISYIKTAGAKVTFYPTSMGEKTPLEAILYNMGYIGGKGWEFGNGENGGVEIRLRGKDAKLGIEAVDGRIQEFFNLIQDVQVVEEGSTIAELFLHILNDWLGFGGGNMEEDPVRVLNRLKILQQILTNHTDKLGKKPTETLQVIRNILDEFVASRKTMQEQREAQQHSTAKPSLKGLGKIIDPTVSAATALIRPPQSATKTRYIGEDSDDEDEEMDEATALASSEDSDSMERITITLSLLSSMLANPETPFTVQDERLLHTLTPSLEYLCNAPTDLVDPSIRSLAVNISTFLTFFTPNTDANPTTPDTQSTLSDKQKSTYKTAFSYLTDQLVPIRAHGLYLLRQLILARAPILDVPVTLRILIGMVKDPDSFVYLNVIKCLQSLSDKHPSTVVRLLVESYMDDSGTMTLDERLRVGEALLGTVEREGRLLVGEVARAVADGMIEVVSRRRRREDKSEADMGDEVKASLNAMKPPLNPFRDPSDPDYQESEQSENEEGDSPLDVDESGKPLPPHAKLVRQHHIHIIRNWLPPPGTHLEDVRIRTSALSILSAAAETNPLGIGPSTCEMAMDISLAILQLETTVEKGILRRSAMVCLAGLLKIWDQPGAGWLRKRLNEVKRVTEYVRGVDNDGLVREQARQVVEMVEGVWMEILSGGKQGGHADGGTLMKGLVIGDIGLEGMGRQWVVAEEDFDSSR
ncbi:hypothetical protein BDZ91DRAFT_674570 [Kalaharituber pfeilii]|nr:hypothetical protein BDZ91DRAFT_674570 [Kalaharituber pfeilii]